MSDEPSHFLDASVVRPMLLGSYAYQQYFQSQFQKAQCSVSPYVLMEVHRSYLRNLIEFYFTLKLPQILTLGDALAYWSNRFQGSKHKAIQQMMAQLLDRSADSPDIFQDKRSVLIAIELLIQSFVTSLHSHFVNTGHDSTDCTRAKITLNVEAEDFAAELFRFAETFDDVEQCRQHCRIDEFLLQDRRAEATTYTQQKDSLPKNSQSRGFIKIADALQQILEQGADVCSCKRCERIGDAVIALDAPREMQLDHTDHSFDYLCPPLGQLHQKHPSEVEVITRGL
ncbi:hypothetical protein ACQ4M3_32920 [Leptolyngbya sp. AN03gr2]